MRLCSFGVGCPVSAAKIEVMGLNPQQSSGALVHVPLIDGSDCPPTLVSHFAVSLQTCSRLFRSPAFNLMPHKSLGVEASCSRLAGRLDMHTKRSEVEASKPRQSWVERDNLSQQHCTWCRSQSEAMQAGVQ